MFRFQHIILLLISLLLLAAFTSCSHRIRKSMARSHADSLISIELKTGDNERVLAFIDSLEEEDAVSPVVANFRRGYAYERMGQRHHAEIYWKKVMAVKKMSNDDTPSYLHAATFLANRLMSKNDTEGAIQTATEALKTIAPYDDAKPLFKAMLLQVLGSCQTRLHQTDDAAQSHEASFRYFLQAVDEDSTEYSLRNTIIGLENIATSNLNSHNNLAAERWIERADSLLTVYTTLADAKPEKIDKLQSIVASVEARIKLRLDKKEESAKAFDKYKRTKYAQTPEGRFKSARYLMALKRYEEVADIYTGLDGWMAKKNGKLSLENIKGHYASKFKANYRSGRKDTALAVAKTVFEALDSAITDYQESEAVELATIYDMQQKEAEIARQKAELSQQHIYQLAGALVLLIAFFIIYSVNRLKMLRKLEEKNRQLFIANEKAEESSRMKTAFIQQISHEIRTPLNILSGFTQVMTTPGMTLDDDTRTHINQQITENTDRITGLVNKMLELSDAGSTTVIERTDEVTAIQIASEAAQASGITQAAHVDFSMDVEEESAAALLHTNLHAAVRALSLVLDNARKFTAPPEAAQTATVATARQQASLSVRKEAQTMCFIVTDSGPGIPAADSERIFDEFVQLDEYYNGTGIGLTIARSMARRLGGDIWLDTSYTTGARFILTLPM